MLTAFEEAKKSPQRGAYSFKAAAVPRLSVPTPDKPLVYSLVGHHDEPSSLVACTG